MLDKHSPLGKDARFEGNGIQVTETPDFSLQQVSGFGKNFEKELSAQLGKLPAKIGIAVVNNDCTVMRVAPEQFWIIAAKPVAIASKHCLITPLSSGRCRIALSGEKSRTILARCAQIDFSTEAFKPNQFVLTGIHHTPVLIHCTDANEFHIYALRTFALNVWEWIVDCAEGVTTAG